MYVTDANIIFHHRKKSILKILIENENGNDTDYSKIASFLISSFFFFISLKIKIHFYLNSKIINSCEYGAE